MNWLPEILIGGTIGWIFLAIMSAYYFGKMKGAEPKLHTNKAEREPDDEVYRELIGDGNTTNSRSA